MSCVAVVVEILGLEHASQRVAQGTQSWQVTPRQLAREAAMAGSAEGAGQPGEVDQSVWRVLEQVVAVDQQHGQLDVGRRLGGVREPVLRESTRFNLHHRPLAAIPRQLLDT